MLKVIEVKHSFNAGDLIALLPGMQHLYKTRGIKFRLYQRLDFPGFYYEGATSPTTNADGQMVCMNREMFDRLYPLIISQDYIESFEVWDGQKYHWDIDLSRDSKAIPMPAGHIHHYAWSLIPEFSCDLSKPWLSIEKQSIASDKYKDKIIVNRTQRYNNPYITYHFLRNYQDRVMFAGTETEHQIFCKDFNLDIPLLKTDNFYQLAQIIQWSKLFIGGQSLLWHIADAIKHPRILELCPQFPNTFPTGANGHGFYRQTSLELYFKQMIQ